MKILKIILIFIVLIGGIFLALNWDSLFGEQSKKTVRTDKKIDITQKCDEIRKAWEKTQRWDMALYEEQKSTIEQEEHDNCYMKDGYATAMTTLQECAINKACGSFKAVLNDPSIFSETLLSDQYKGVLRLVNDFNISGDERIDSVNHIHDLYTQALQFSKSSHEVKAFFDQKNRNWESLESKKTQILNQAKTIKENTYFMFIQNVPGLSEGLDESIIANKIDNQANTFYADLSLDIANFYRKLKAKCAPANLKTLQDEFIGKAKQLQNETRIPQQPIKDLIEEFNNTVNTTN